MYVIDLLCDALALRVPDRLSSGPMAVIAKGGVREGGRGEGARRNGRNLMETTRTTTMEKGSPNGKRIPALARLLVLCVIRLG